MVGITGTNGKTTTAYFIKHLLDKLHGSCGLIGTIEYILGSHNYQANYTTPGVATNQKMLREMVQNRCQAAVMEVTSHALDQGRVGNIDFDIAIFTNLTLEHLDYHHSMENYLNSKRRLFESLVPERKKKGFFKTAIVNADDPNHGVILEGCRANVITYGIEHPAVVRASNIHLSEKGTTYHLIYDGKTYPVFLSLIGRFNVYNSLATIACGISQGFPIEAIIDTLKTLTTVPGRIESVPDSKGLNLYVDFAHTPDALKNVLKCLQELKTNGKIITVFGCGGDRDRIKRPKMAQVAEEYSDLCIVRCTQLFQSIHRNHATYRANA